MTVVDSSGWLEFFTDGPLADRYSGYLADDGLEKLLTPSVVLFEVYKWVKRQRTEEEALVVAAQMGKTEVVALTTTVALTAADLGLEHGLAMADSIVYATAQLNGAELVTSDADFEGLPHVAYLAAGSGREE